MIPDKKDLDDDPDVKEAKEEDSASAQDHAEGGGDAGAEWVEEFAYPRPSAPPRSRRDDPLVR